MPPKKEIHSLIKPNYVITGRNILVEVYFVFLKASKLSGPKIIVQEVKTSLQSGLIIYISL